MPHRRSLSPVLPTADAHTRLRPIGLEGSRITGGFWADWQQQNRAATTPHAFEWLERDGTVDNLRRLDASSGTDVARRGLWFTDSDLYKALEGVAWDLGREHDATLDDLVAEYAEIIRRAQQPDGYVNSFVQAGLDKRWEHLGHSHELYCIGHLIQAGIAHRRTTGRSELFDVAVKAADGVVADFGAGRRTDVDGHEEIELALVELYRETGTASYLDLAQQFIDMRGYKRLQHDGKFDSEYFQDATPVRDERTVVGHAVRAVYLLAGVVDLYLETGEEALLTSALRQWDSMIGQKTYLTGAIGSRFVGEAFGDAYELPPDLVYGETCASIGVVMVAWRLLIATGESRFADLIERNLYNLIAASTAADRQGFFYNNPAQRRSALPPAPTEGRPTRADAPGTRPAWFECACCPPNVMRTIASLAAYVATSTDDGVQVHQFMSGLLEADLAAGRVELQTETEYPSDGRYTVRVTRTPASRWSLALRVPAWAAGSRISVNGGEEWDALPDERGYHVVDRVWVAGDVVEYVMPMEPRLTVAHPAVDALRGAAAIERGPVVYALESKDQPAGVDLNHIEIDGAAGIREAAPIDIAGQRVVPLHVPGIVRDDGRRAPWVTVQDQPDDRGAAVEMTAIPYALWANRGPSVMRVFAPLMLREPERA